ncbi:hypothetical protein [Streptomyces achromogenes]|uniref:hypothetical protein n=1 Tax=Streptomyces achromogenes TaxID=67255 RepID=UPI00367F8EF3
MPTEITLPVHVRVGDHAAGCWGEVTIPVVGGRVSLRAARRTLADFLRAAADEIETPTEDDAEGVPDASADQ